MSRERRFDVGKPKLCLWEKKRGNKYFKVSVREMGTSVRFLVVMDVLLSDNRKSLLSECVPRASLSLSPECWNSL